MTDTDRSPPADIVKADVTMTYKTGALLSSLTPEDIEAVLGFKANPPGGCPKVTHSWYFTVNGVPCGIWDYKGYRWSVYDPRNLLQSLFAAACAIEPKTGNHQWKGTP